jgi:hypothetical protein
MRLRHYYICGVDAIRKTNQHIIKILNLSKMTKQKTLTYHNENSCLNNVIYQIIRMGKKNITLEPVYGQHALTGLPTFRQPFNIAVNDLNEAIKAGIYTINN